MPYTEIAIDLKARDQMSSVLTQVEKRLGVFNKTGLATGVSFAVVNQAMNLAMQGVSMLEQFITGSIDAYKKWEMAVVGVTNVLKEQDQVLLPHIMANVQEMAKEFGDSAVEMAKAYSMIYRSGVSAAGSLDMLRASEKLAQAQQISVAESTNILTDTMKVFDLSSQDSTDLANKLAKTIDNTTLSVSDLDSIMNMSGPTFVEAGGNINDFLAILITLNQEGFNNFRKMSSGFTSGLQSLLDPSDKARQAMSDFGLTIDPVILKGEGLVAFLRRLQTATGGNITALQDIFGNEQSVAFMTALMTNNFSDFDTQLGYVSDSTDKLGSDFDTAMNTATKSWQKWEAAAGEVQKGIGGAILGKDSQEGTLQMEAMAKAAEKLGWTVDRTRGYMSKAGENYGEPVVMADVIQAKPGGLDSALTEVKNLYKQTFAEMAEQARTTEIFGPLVDQLKVMKDALVTQVNIVASAEAQLRQYRTELKDDQDQITKMTEIRPVTEALRFIPLALDNAAYQSRIFTGALTDQEQATVTLVASIRQHRAELDALTKEANAYSQQAQTNSLAELQIQLDASDNRGRMTREEKEQMKTLQRADLELRINQAENSLKQSQLRDNVLSDEEQRLKDTETAYQVHVDDLNDTYQKDLQNLQTQINQKKQDIEYYVSTFIPEQNTKLIKLEQEFATEYNKAVNDNDFTATEKKQLEDLLAQALATYNGIIRYRNQAMGTSQPEMLSSGAMASTLADRWAAHIQTYHHCVASLMDRVLMAAHREPIPGLDIGGTILESGIAKVHRGETFFPPGGTQNAASSNHVELNVGGITIYANNADDVEAWGHKLGAGLAEGFLDATSAGTTTVTSRKTGASIVVPGTTVTTRTGRTPTATIPVLQSIRHKSRFRVG